MTRKPGIGASTLAAGLALAACSGGGGSSSGGSAASGAATAEEPAAEEPATEEPAAEEPAGGSEAAVTYEPLTLQTATSYNEVDFGGQMIAYFLAYLEEHSGGAITGDCYYGGSFCQAPEINEYLMSGELSFSICQPVYAMTYFPFSWGVAGYGGMSQPTDILMSSLYDNEETAALIDAQGKENNMKVIGYTEAGPSLLWSTKPLTGYVDASGLTIGSPINLDIYEALGFNTVAVEPPDMYDSLQRGVVDLVAFSATDGTTQKLYEVAPNIGDMRAYFSHSTIAFNYDLWDTLPAETQELLIEAAWATKEYSAIKAQELMDQLTGEIIPGLSNGSYNLFSEEDGIKFNQMSMEGNAALLRGFAQNLGCEEGMETILAYWAQELGYEGTF